MKTRLLTVCVFLFSITLPSLLILSEAQFIMRRTQPISFIPPSLILPLQTFFPTIENTSTTKPSRQVVSAQDGIWQIVSSPTTNDLFSIEMVSASEGWAVGDNGAIIRYINGRWQTVNSPTDKLIWSLDMVSAEEGWAVGATGTILHYSNGTWQVAPSPTNYTLSSVNMVSPEEGWAVGGAGTNGIILHYINGSWQIPAIPPYTRWLWSVDMVSENEGWAVGDGGNILHYNNGIWQGPIYGTGQLRSVDMVSENEGWAVGQRIFHYENGMWQLDPSFTTFSLNAIHMVSENEGWAVGDGVALDEVILHYKNGMWQLDPSPASSRLYSVNMISADEGWAVGWDGTILHYMRTEGPPFSISGQVSDIDNNPISNVTISAGLSISVATDANGVYTITNLVTGTYTLTPTKSFGYYAFSPVTRTVAVPPDQTGQNFIEVTDSDGDGLYDYWEGYGRNGLNLPAMGADPNHKDIFVEVDYMEECTPVFPGVCYIHSHRPNPDAMALVVESFKNAPVGNPDGIGGINLHVDFGSDTPMKPDGTEWGEFSGSNPLQHTDFLNETTFNTLEQDNFAPVRDGVFHYVIFAHFLGDVPPCTSGRSWGIPSFDFVVSLGGWGGAPILPIEPHPCFAPVRQNSTGTLWQQAGTFMHELGHNLGLRHGGGDNINRKSNYLSIMSYDFQTDGLIYDNHQGGYFDFSRSNQIPPLYETSLNETGGLNGGSSSVRYGTKWRCPNRAERTTTSANSSIDWNCDGDGIDSGINVDINNDDLCVGPGENDILDTPPTGDDVVDNNIIHNGPNGRCESATVGDDVQLSTLLGFNDWASLVYDGGRSVNGAGSTLPIELTIDEDDSLLHPYRIGLFGPAGVSAPPNYTFIYTLTIANIGDNGDVYTLTSTSSLGWADLSSVPSVISLSSGATHEITTSVTIPSTASATDVDVVRIAATSGSNSALWTSHYFRISVKSFTVYLPIILK